LNESRSEVSGLDEQSAMLSARALNRRIEILLNHSMHTVSVKRGYDMVKEAGTKIYKTCSRHFLNLPKDMITDSNFPLAINEKVLVKINYEKLTIERAVKVK
jgi:hypothetical protein